MVKTITTIFLLLISRLLVSQVNLDFETGNSNGWTINGMSSIQTNGADPIGGFPAVFPGLYPGDPNTTTSLMLANGPVAGFTDGGASQTFVVTPQNTCLIVRYATVLGDAGHGCTACSPRFAADVLIGGNALPCSHVDVNAGCSLVGWQSGPNGAAYKPWTVVSFDLRPYLGQNVTIKLNSFDCCGGAHWAYSYIDCSAQPMGLFLNGNAIPSNQTNSYLCNGAANIISAPSGFNYLWTGPNSSSPVNGATTQTINASEAGTYSVNLTTPGLNCADINLWSSFGFIDNPTANFDVSPVCFGTPTSFTNTSMTPTLNVSLGVTNTYTWSYDDGTPDESLNSTTHLYGGTNTNATYNVTLTAAAQACVSQTVKSVLIGAKPEAYFISDTVCYGTPTNLVDNSNGNGNNLTNYIWDFSADGVVEITGNNTPTFIFSNFGDNAVNYTVSTNPSPNLTCSTFTTINVWVNDKPEASFSFINNCINNQPNQLDASTSSIQFGTINSYDWNYGDGQIDNLTTTNTNHSYNVAGSYQVSLTVTSNKGCKNSITHQIEVYPKPNLNIVASPLICLGTATTFSAIAMPNNGNVVSWVWDVNNSTNSIELNGKQNSFIFPSEGTQTINLVATTDNGCQESFTRQVYINYIPKPDFTVDDPDGCSLPHCVTFTDNSTVTGPAKIINWNWSFGNGTSNSANTNANQQTCYVNLSSNQLAYYTPTLTTKTDSGCVASKIKKDMITVFPKPIASYTIVPEFGNVIVPLVHFINQSLDYTSYVWAFGDGKTDITNVNPDHYYETVSSDDYYSSLIVTNQYGCTDTANVKVNIAPEFVFYIPNAFSPNEDFVNDGFTGAGIGIAKYEMWIYDRWGASIFYSNDISLPWNGKINGKDIDAKQDVYTWKVELKDIFGKKHDYVGHVTLLR